MTEELQIKGKHEVGVHYVNTAVPLVVVENFGGYYLENIDLPLEEVLQDQEIVYQSLQTSSSNNIANAPGNARFTPVNNDQGSGEMRATEREGESSQVENLDSQMAEDEALARALQEMEDQLVDTSLSESTGAQDAENGSPPSPAVIHVSSENSSPPSPTVTSESTSTNTASVAAREDNVDPDNMTYEELQSLGEAIGSQSRGLSDELISYLPSFKYKTGFFSRKEKHEECVICYMEYRNRDRLITLPCQHRYHSNCVTRWLKLNKACPICNEEVFG